MVRRSLLLGASALLAATALLLWLRSGAPPVRPGDGTGGGHQPPTVQHAARPQTAAPAIDSDPTRHAASSATAPRAAEGRLVVRVARANDVPVPGVRVRAGEHALGATDADGRVTADLPPGTFALRVDGDSLPRGSIAPPLRDRGPSGQFPAGYSMPVATVAANANAEAVVRIWAACEVVGVVVDTAGTPIAGCPIRLQARRPGLVSLAYDAATDDTGLFAFPNVAPGGYWLRVHPAQALPRAVPPAALPLRVDAGEGTRITLDPIVCGDARAAITGRVLDQDGEPLAGVEVLAYPRPDPRPDELGMGLADAVATATTSADGAFALAVPPVVLVVQAHAEGSLLPFGDPQRLTRPIAPVTVHAQPGPNPIGDFAAERSRPFTLVVTVNDDLEAIRAGDPTLRRVRPPDVFLAPADGMRDESRWTRVRFQGGTATYRCETPSPPLVLVIRRRGFAALTRQVDPAPGEVRWQIRYP